MEVQRLTLAETLRYRAIRLRALEDAPFAFSTSHDEAAKQPLEWWRDQLSELTTFIAVHQGADAGVVRGLLLQSRDALLLSLWVAPEARGRGVGEALIDTVAGWAREHGRRRLLLDVRDDNAPAIALYERKGFVPTGVVTWLPPPREGVREHQRALRL